MATQEVWTIGRILKWTQDFFAKHGVESPRLDAEVLLAHLLDKERIYLYVHFDEPLEKPELARFHDMVKQRVSHVPVAYILGEKEFMGLPFRVTEDTLVPRPDTEILVQAAVERLKKLAGVQAEAAGEAEPKKGKPVLKFADIGTGTGAICLSVLKFTKDTEAATVDISEKARAVAEGNAEALGVADRVTFYTGDLLGPVQGQKFHAILSNPPYIPDAEVGKLQADVRVSEPHTALAGGADGLDFYRRLCAEGPEMLLPGGFLAFEVGIHQAEAVAELAKANPLIGDTEIIKDLAGIERVVVADLK